MKRFSDYLKSINLNDSESREVAWHNQDFRKSLSEHAGKVVSDSTNAFFDGEKTLDAEVVTDFFQWNDYFMLAFLWLDLERHVYVSPITEKVLSDAIVNGYSEFTSEPSRYSDNPIPNLEATYY